MSKIAIVTDSTSDLPEELVKKFNINVIPLTVHFGEKEYKDDGKDLILEDFFIKLKESDIFPTTSQPSIGDFIKLYSRLLCKTSPALNHSVSSIEPPIQNYI